jgi:hypothetical protein
MKRIGLLRQRAPGLAHLIEAAGKSEFSSLAWAAARAAVERTGLSEPLINQAVQRAVPDAELQVRVQALAEKLDNDYFALKEPLEEREDAGKTDPQVILAFSRARAADAVAEALAGNGMESAASAAYEALIATDDLEHLTDALKKALPRLGSD